MKLKVISLILVTLAASLGLLTGAISIEAWNNIVVLLFVGLLLVGAGATVARGISYLRAHEPMPKLLIRDIFSRTGLAIPLTLIFGIRFVRPYVDVAGLAQQPWWILVTSVPAIIGVAVYAYFELFILGGPDRAVYRLIPTQLADISRKLDDNNALSVKAFTEANDLNNKLANLREEFNTVMDSLVSSNRQRDTILNARDATEEARRATGAD